MKRPPGSFKHDYRQDNLKVLACHTPSWSLKVKPEWKALLCSVHLFFLGWRSIPQLPEWRLLDRLLAHRSALYWERPWQLLRKNHRPWLQRFGCRDLLCCTMQTEILKTWLERNDSATYIYSPTSSDTWNGGGLNMYKQFVRPMQTNPPPTEQPCARITWVNEHIYIYTSWRPQYHSIPSFQVPHNVEHPISGQH